ncbi:putative transcription factor GTE12 [Blattamonas nauphoetae]|uniref:Transcription factor GTE12 n=1 Tax=Blattamonas nauphoetae TaxID=2049346 RepID=A0ABQ9YFU5_9EUKA|nr:putative transcription factor GTE12 [Blattamonas nauphoetae]
MLSPPPDSMMQLDETSKFEKVINHYPESTPSLISSSQMDQVNEGDQTLDSQTISFTHLGTTQHDLGEAMLKDHDSEEERKMAITQEIQKKTEAQMKYLRKLLNDLLRHKYAPQFSAPVDPIALNIPDYTHVITHPMDLGTIKKGIEQETYNNNVDAVLNDIYLVFDNCFHYNPPANDVSIMCDELQQLAVKKLRSSQLFTAEQVALVAHTFPHKYFKEDPVTASETISAESENEGAGKHPRPAQDMHIPRVKPNLDHLLTPFEGDNVPLTAEEKEILFSQIRTLEAKFLHQVVTFIQYTTPQTAVDAPDGVVEFDIDDIDPRVLQHLRKYVRQCVEAQQSAKK